MLTCQKNVVSLQPKIQVAMSLYEIPYINLIIRTFATRFDMSRQMAYQYLQKYQGITFLIEFYDVEHLQDMEETVDDLVFWCKKMEDS